MRYNDVAQRLAELESIDEERQQRVYGRVWEQLSDDDAGCLTSVVKRHSIDPTMQPTEHELSVMRQVDALTIADPEGRAADVIGGYDDH